MIRYVFKDGPVRIKNAKKADPQRLGESFAKAGWDKSAVYKAAENNPRHPVHKHLEWDDAKAGKAYRMEQIGELVRIIQTDDPEVAPHPVRAALSVNDGRGHKYHSIQDVLGSVELMDAVLRQAEKDLVAFEDRYQELKEVCAIVSDAREAVARRRSALHASNGAPRRRRSEHETRAPA
jgi:hypothetical protein